ncbi:MAG TPA: helix-hairpin-helix domain-containing protein [Euzebyales bacterium]
MWTWVSRALRSRPVRRVLFVVVGAVVRRRLTAMWASLLEDAEQHDESRRVWPLLVLLGGAAVGWLVYRSTRRGDHPVPWEPPAASSTPPPTQTPSTIDRPSEDVAATDPPALADGSTIVGEPLAEDDLKIIEGIGPKIEQVLNEGGIVTWGDLAAADVDRLREILDAAGPRYRMHDPAGWPEQAQLLDRGAWAEFAALTGRLEDDQQV